MATVDPLLIDTVNQILTDACAPERVVRAEIDRGGFDAGLWATLEDAGLTLVGVPESAGGSGGTLQDAAAVVKAAGFHAAPVPLADSLFAARVAATAGAAVGPGPHALLIPGKRTTWAPVAESIVLVHEDASTTSRVSVDPASRFTVRDAGVNYAGEPFAHVSPAAGTSGTTSPAEASSAEASSGAVTAELAHAMMALSRSLLMAGALHRAVDLSVQYAQEREQFGKPIGKQQAIQHYLSQMAGEAYVAEAAADNAVDVVAAGAPADEQIRIIAGAKAVAGRAVAYVARYAHQIHGAIGFTDEHRLQLTTRRLWSWRDEHGTDAQWAARLGRSLVAAGGARLWPTLTNWPPAG